MFQFLEKLRSKSLVVRQRVAFFTALFVAGLIFIVWASVLYPSLNEDSAVQARVAASVSPTSIFSSSFSQGFTAMRTQFGQLKTMMSSLTSTSAYYNATSSNAETETISY